MSKGNAKSRRAQWVREVGFDPTRLAPGVLPPAASVPMARGATSTRSRRDAWLAAQAQDGVSGPSTPPAKQTLASRKEQFVLTAAPPSPAAVASVAPVVSSPVAGSPVVTPPISTLHGRTRSLAAEDLPDDDADLLGDDDEEGP